MSVFERACWSMLGAGMDGWMNGWMGEVRILGDGDGGVSTCLDGWARVCAWQASGN